MQSAETLEEINQKTLTIRDQFAIAALQGFMANKNRPTQFNPNDDADYIYKIADAMMEARKE
jgi:hypothetical protein